MQEKKILPLQACQPEQNSLKYSLFQAQFVIVSITKYINSALSMTIHYNQSHVFSNILLTEYCWLLVMQRAEPASGWVQIF
jgi:hypothetical protein